MADGALAIGLPADVARQGFAAGFKMNANDMEAARLAALASCHEAAGASAEAKKLCTVVATFRDQCFAVAMDPADGTPGVGWAVAETSQLANQQALEQCRGSAGPKRRDYCEINPRSLDSHGCDGSAR
jgi:hypothetical protein